MFLFRHSIRVSVSVASVCLRLRQPYSKMSSPSESAPLSTQAILEAQFTPPPKLRTLPRDESIIVISSSPEQADTPFENAIISGYIQSSPKSPIPTSPDAAVPNESEFMEHENSVELLEVRSFSRIVEEYKFCSSTPILNTVRPPLQGLKTHRSNVVEETKTTTFSTKGKIKSTLSTRVAVPSKSTALENVQPLHANFFTTWATAQAPTVRPTKASAKPRRKVVRKKKAVEVVLLSPKTGQESIRRDHGESPKYRRLGKKVSTEGMWNAASRGLEGELYDEDRGVILSQELRREDTPDVSLSKIEIISVNESPRNSSEMSKRTPVDVKCVSREETTIEDKPARRRGKGFDDVDNNRNIREDGMPSYSTMTLKQLRVFSFPSKILLTHRLRCKNLASNPPSPSR